MTSRRLALFVLLAGCSAEEPPPVDLEDLPVPRIHTPRWAFEPWISKDISDAEDTRAFVRGFVEREIPVGVVVLDSPWETNYNSLVPDPKRYPDFGGMVAELKSQKIRVVLWVTQMINESSFDLEPGGSTYEGPSPNFAEAEARGFFVNDAQRFFWWKGSGCALDFFDPEAVRWWHRQQDPLLELGVAGWKLDFGDSYVMTPTVSTHAGLVPHQAYSEAYYRDFFAYGVNKRGPDELVTMVRPYDESYHFPGRFFARREHAPVTWVGDNRRDFVGLVDALDHMFRSARAGYVVIGSDVGGYLDRDDRQILTRIPFDPVVFARWTAVAAMTPFMQLHGRANLVPWAVPERSDEVLAAYKSWSVLHRQLVPFFYSLAEEAYAGAGTIIRPVGAEEAWKDDWRFEVGDAFLVAPILDHSGAREVALPGGARWIDWWDPEVEHEGGAVITASVGRDLLRMPLYLKSGAIVPLEVQDGLQVLIVPPSSPEAPGRFVLHEPPAPTEIRTTAASNGVRIDLSAALQQPATFRVRSPRMAGQPHATIDGAPVGAEQVGREVWIASPAGARRIELTLTGT